MGNKKSKTGQGAGQNSQVGIDDPQRRRLIKGMAAAAGAVAAAGYLPAGFATGSGIPGADNSAADDFADIRHIVVLMMENRSFDHMLGWVPGADGAPAGRRFTNNDGRTFTSVELSDTQNLFGGDPQHGYEHARICHNGGAMDGFLRAKNSQASGLSGLLQNHTFPIGYFPRAKVPFFSGCADYFTIGDRYFTGVMGPTWPNRIYMHAGQADRLATGALPADHSGPTCNLPTIWDLASAAKVSHKYYYSDIPNTALWGTRLLGISRPFGEFLSDAAAGTLPSIAFIDPAMLGEAIGLSNDDHPLADIRNGQAFMNSVYNAVRLGPGWANTLLIINYDEFGGFADHVPPPLAPVSASEANLTGGGNDGRLGIRVPLIVIGPRARRNARLPGNSAVVKEQYDPNAILNFICDRFGLPRLNVARSATSGSLATALLPKHAADYSVPPAFPVSAGRPIILARGASTHPIMTVEQAYVAGMGEHLDDLRRMQNLAAEYGFPVYGLRL